ncbi:MAG TPA: phenylalanine--tRNA ligase subunit alpha [Thermomicrobiales bacterium]|nr:phenylalanine--tRNA ligase subunit alpha [Thermomicrobiales bacterium]
MAQETAASTAQIAALEREALDSLAAVEDEAGLERWFREYLGRRGGKLSGLLSAMGRLAPAERPQYGAAVNQARARVQEAYEARQTALGQAALTARLGAEAVDVTLPGRPVELGSLHPTTLMTRELSEIFALMGFQTVEGPEVEETRFNFDKLNIPPNHPARDVWDTFYVGARGTDDTMNEIVLRTHTSPMQARIMEAQEPPVRVIVPGRVYRYEATDASHESIFFQLEGLAVDEHITMTDLKGVLTEMARQLFGPKTAVRFRCDFFPFVEPGVDFSATCSACGGKGCRVCKGTGWLELGGAGMVHPNVLRNVGYDPQRYSGFAFGLGIERIVMIKYGIDDIRNFYANDLRFLEQFASTRI